MKTMALVIGALALALYIYRPSQKSMEPLVAASMELPSPAPETQTKSQQPTPAHLPQKPLAQSIERLARERGISNEQMQGYLPQLLSDMPKYHIIARILQHLDDGHLIIENLGWYPDEGFPRAQNYAVFDHPLFIQR